MKFPFDRTYGEKIACIGSRDTPPEILTVMEELGALFVKNRFFVVTGNAKGADQAFAHGGNKINSQHVILHLPWSSYEEKAIEVGNLVNSTYLRDHVMMAKAHHPAWDNLSQGAQKMMIRNAAIVMDSIVCIAYLNHSKKGGGGTGHGWRIAGALNIPRYDLANEKDLSIVKGWF